MPEGHTLHRLARDQQELVGHRLQATSPQGKFTNGAGAVDGHTLVEVRAVGKHLLQRFEHGRTVHVHLGMQGRYLRFAPPQPDQPPLPQVRLRLATADGAVAWDLIAPSTTELLDDDAVIALTTTLGPDPLDDGGFDRGRAIANLRAGGATAVGEALLDQRRIAGVGNVFRAEALLRAHLHPCTPAGALSDDDYDTLLGHLERLMKDAVDANEITAKLVYKQTTCLQCGRGTPVESFDLHGRTAYVCPTCQPEPEPEAP